MENWRRNIKKDLAVCISKIVSQLKTNEPLKNYTTFKIGGPAEYFAEIENIQQLSELFLLCKKENIPIRVLGLGSNVLISDKGLKGLVIRLRGDFCKFSFNGTSLYASSGVFISKVLSESLAKSLSGLEILSGIPGTLGGALVSNAGTKEKWIQDVVEYVDVLSDTGEKSILRKDDIRFHYRYSSLKNTIIIGSKLNLKKEQKNDILNMIKTYDLRRRENQPLDSFCAGSVFKNVSDKSAGFLIESCGLKGFSFGGAKISDKHANFIINHNNASSDDVINLIRMAKQKVKEKFGIELDLEIEILGEKIN